MELSPLEAGCSSAAQEISTTLSNQKVHYRIHKSPSLAPMPSYEYIFFSLSRSMAISYCEEWLISCATLKLEDHPLSAERDSVQYIRSYPPYLEAVFFIRNLRTRCTLVTRDALNMDQPKLELHRTTETLR
jgi:hypothetical protein